MRTIPAVRFLSRSAPIALLAALSAGCSSDTARFSDPFSNPFKSRSYAQSEPATTASITAPRSTALPSADDVVRRGRPVSNETTQSYAAPQPNYQAVGAQVKSETTGRLQNGYDKARAQANTLVRQRPSRAGSAIPQDWKAAPASPFSDSNADAGLTTSSIKPKANAPYQWKPGTPYNKQMQLSRPVSEPQSGWTRAGGTQIRIGQGDSVQSLSRRFGVPAAAIASTNGIAANAALNPGQTLVIPTYSLGAASPAPERAIARAPLPEAKAVRPVTLPQSAAAPKRPMASAGGPVADDGDITASIPQRPRRDEVAGAPMPKPNGARLAWLGGQDSARKPLVRPASHMVMMGESVNSIARRYGVSADELGRLNGLGPSRPLRIGQSLRIPGAEAVADRSAHDKAKASIAAASRTPAGRLADRTTTATISRPAAPRPLMSAAAEVKPQPQKTALRPEAPAASVAPAQPLAMPSGAPVATASATPSFRWPVRGRVIGNFVPGERDGIALSVPEGTDIRAADEGVVTYAGNELKGYGNVVLVRHPSGYTTAYAHASEMLVRRGDTVNRGQVIAKAGQTGGVATPQLHFEVRKGSEALNPMAFLKN